MEGKKIKVFLIDVHSLIHRAYHALPNFTSSKGEPTGALYGLSLMLLKIISDFKPDYLFAAYDLPTKTFRHESFEKYKAHRPKADPGLISQLKKSYEIFSAFNIPCFSKEGFEADDVLGSIVNFLKNKNETDIIIVSGDLDTLQLVEGEKVKVFTLRKGIQDTILYDEEKVKERFGFPPQFLPDFKALRGDPSDNIPGIKGIGEKTAKILVKSFQTIENLYQNIENNPEEVLKVVSKKIFEVLKNNKEEAFFSKTLCLLRKDVPLDFNFPSKKWIEDLDVEKIKRLFKELEFKSLLERINKVFSKNEDKIIQEVSQEKVKKIGIALWLLNPEITQPSLDDILSYGRTKDFQEAEERIFAKLKEENLLKIYEEIELPLANILEEAEKRGILIDVPYLKSLEEKYTRKKEIIKKEIFQIAKKEINLNSPKQVSKLLFEDLKLISPRLKKTKEGLRTTQESELLKIKDQHPIVEKILEYRNFQKILSTYIKPLIERIDENNRIHTHFNQIGTMTGRISSSNPNLQNIPAYGELGREIRKAFIATPGFKLVKSDYSQIEMRILALLSQDEKLIEIFQNNEDIHIKIASLIFKVPFEEVTEEMRRKAKTINFGILYGMGPGSLGESLGISYEEAKRFQDDFFNLFPKVKEYFKKVKEKAAKNGYVEILTGRKRYLPNLKSQSPYLVSEAERIAINTPLQGLTADFIKMAIVRIDKNIKEENLEKKAFLILTIHDELIYEVSEEEISKVMKIIKDGMENVIENECLPFSVKQKIGNNWEEIT